MDVHAPHQPIHGFKDFLVHIVTITIGLLIAVGIEGLVERHREHVLVREARATLREEIEHNRDSMKSAVDGIRKQREQVAHNIVLLKKIRANPKDRAAQDGDLSSDFGMTSMRDTAWKTAQGTNALSYMPYDEAQKYADLYGMETVFNAQQEKIIEDQASFIGFIQKTHQDHVDMTPAEAAEALNIFGRWQTHLLYLDISAKVSYESAQAFLEGKPMPTSMHETI